MHQRFVVAITSLVLSACSIAPNTPDRTHQLIQVQAGQYDATKSLEFMGCVMDALVPAQVTDGFIQVRQLKHSDGYRLDLMNGSLPYMVAHFQANGNYELRKLSSTVLILLIEEQNAAEKCFSRYKTAQK